MVNLFFTFDFNTDIYRVSLRVQSEYVKMMPRITLNMVTFYVLKVSRL